MFVQQPVVSCDQVSVFANLYTLSFVVLHFDSRPRLKGGTRSFDTFSCLRRFIAVMIPLCCGFTRLNNLAMLVQWGMGIFYRLCLYRILCR